MTCRDPIRAAYFTTPGAIEVRRVSRPVPAEDEVLIEVHACGICGSDLHIYGGDCPAPGVCPGHEICGRVGTGAAGFAAGLGVVVEPIRACGVCAECRGGEPNLCPRVEILGSSVAGGFAEAVLAPRSAVHPIPAGLALDVAVLAEPLAVAVHAVQRSAVTPGASVFVLGGGTIGLLTAFVAARAGARVTIAARHPHQRDAAERLGVSRAVHSERDAVLDARGPGPADVVFETVGGRSDTLDLAIETVRPGGSVIMLGVFTPPLTLDPLRFLAKEVRLTSSTMYCRKTPRPDFVVALELLCDEQLRLASLVTHRFDLDAIDAAFATAADKRSGAIKVAVGQKL